MTALEEVHAVLRDICLRPFKDDARLFDDESDDRLDSLEFVNLIIGLENTCHVDLSMVDFDPQTWMTPEDIAEQISQKRLATREPEP